MDFRQPPSQAVQEPPRWPEPAERALFVAMKMRWLVVLPAIGLSVILLGGMASCQTGPPRADMAEGEILVKFRSGVPAARIEAIHRAIGGRVLESWPDIRWQRVAVGSGVSVPEAIREYRTYPEIENAEPNYTQRVQPHAPAELPR
jgi:hypothetical protein